MFNLLRKPKTPAPKPLSYAEKLALLTPDEKALLKAWKSFGVLIEDKLHVTYRLDFGDDQVFLWMRGLSRIFTPNDGPALRPVMEELMLDHAREQWSLHGIRTFERKNEEAWQKYGELARKKLTDEATRHE